MYREIVAFVEENYLPEEKIPGRPHHDFTENQAVLNLNFFLNL